MKDLNRIILSASVVTLGCAALLAHDFGVAVASPQRAAKKRDVSQKADDGRAKQKNENRRPARDSAGAMSVFADIERGWNTNSVDLILKHYPKGKVAIAIDGSGPSGGKFSRSQSHYLLKDLFKYTITRKFEFVQFRKPEGGSTTSFAIAERRYQRSDDGRIFKDKIYVSLQLVGDRWVVSEIKSIR